MSKPSRTTSLPVSAALAVIQVQLLPTAKARARAPPGEFPPPLGLPPPPAPARPRDRRAGDEPAARRVDQCRVRLPQFMRVVGLFRRFSNRLFLHWRSRHQKPRHQTTTNFFTAMNAEHHRHALRCLQARQPSFRPSS